MFPDFDKLLSFVKESTKTFFIVGGTCFVLIFFSEFIGTQKITETVDPFLRVILIICSLGLLSNFFQSTYSFIRSQINKQKRKSNSLKRIKNLTDYEKEILILYISNGVRSYSLDSNDGNVRELERAGISFQSTNYTDGGSHCKYNVTDWAWDFMQLHPEVLDERT